MKLQGRKAAALWAVLTACAALGASALAAFYPPPSTFSLVYPPEHPNVRPGRFAVPACNGLQCRLCPYECFLPEGAVGRCKVRVNYGGRIKTLVYAGPAAPGK
ncbi:MAG: hypothetical protein AB7V08_02635 [Elusimicrobiales bacterium]